MRRRVSALKKRMLLTAALDDCIAFNTLPAACRFGGTEARGLYAYDYNTAYVSITDILGLTGAEWTFDGNALYITVKGGSRPAGTDRRELRRTGRKGNRQNKLLPIWAEVPCLRADVSMRTGLKPISMIRRCIYRCIRPKR